MSGVTPSQATTQSYSPGIFDRLSSGLELYGQAQPFLGSLFETPSTESWRKNPERYISDAGFS